MENVLNMETLFDPWVEGTPNALGFDNPPGETRVVVAMSGGVDSSVTAALLKEQGFDVIGITLQLYDHGAAIQKKGACCAGQDIHDARRVSEILHIPHYVLDYENRFRAAVMEDFADSYIRGETPIPCVTCNQTVKFRDLLASSRDLGAQCLATGHYIQRKVENGRAELHRAYDEGKDQSYFLFATTQDQLDFLRFPLGGMNKSQTRELAVRYGLPVADKPDSQDICFVPQGNYASVIERLRPGAAEPGNIVDMAGNILGSHKGIIYFTIGQRKGLGIGGTPDPLYVIKLKPETREVIVGPEAALQTASLKVDGINWLGDEISDSGQEIGVKVRSTRPPVKATIRPLAGGKSELTFIDGEKGVSPGQAAVFYDGSRVLGGGWIRSTQSAYPPDA